MQDVGIVVTSDTEKCLRSGIVAFLKGVDKNIHQRIDHEDSQEEDGRQQVEPALHTLIIHPGLLP